MHMIEKAFLKPIHKDAFYKRNCREPEITGVYSVVPFAGMEHRLCYEVTYEDGEKDYVSVSDVEKGHYEII